MADRVLDVDPEDFAAAGAVLHRLGLALLEDVFEGGPGLTGERWFDAADVGVFDRLPVARLGWRRWLARLVPPLRDVLTGKTRWRGLAATTPRRLRWSPGAVRARLAIDYHGLEGLRVPEHLLALAGRSAWDAPAFRLAAATLVTDHFRSRLIAPATLSAPRVEPAVMWMIIATARIPLPVLAGLRLAHGAERRALERLQRFARSAIEELTLADDFWSHWIAWHVERRFGIGSELPPEWLSRLRTIGPSVDPATARRWMSPEALTSAYTAWYPPRRRGPAEAGRYRRT